MLNLRLRRPDLARDQVVLLAAGLALLALLFCSPLIWLWGEWRTNAYYEHGPLVPVAALAVGLMALAGVRLRPEGERPVLALVLLGAGVALRVVGAVGGSEFIGSVALLPALAGVLGYVLGGAALRALAFPIAYLIFMIPMPFVDDLGFYFQRFSSYWTATLVGRLGYPIEFWGAEIALPGQNFIVGIPCSGLYSMMTLTALGLLYAWLLRLPSRWRVIALLIAIPAVAIVSNVVRLSSILMIAYHYGTEIAINYYHDFAGAAFWALSLALMLLIGRSLEWRRTSAPA